MFNWLRKRASKWVYNRYYRAGVEFETCIYSGQYLVYADEMIRLARPDDDLPFFLAMPDGTFIKSTGGKTYVVEVADA
jgi:hypothetical protein